MRWKALSCVIAACAGMALANTAVVAATAQQERAKKTAQIPRCAQSLGVLAVSQPERNWWSELQLGSPEALLRVFVQQSGCFTQVDRGAGLAAAQRERELASGGNLQQGSNVGGGQIQAADYVLVPDIVSQNANARGNNFGAAIGGLLGARNPVLGQLAGSISINSSTADVTLAITDVRSTRQLAVLEGHSEKARHRLWRRRRRVRRQRLRSGGRHRLQQHRNRSGDHAGLSRCVHEIGRPARRLAGGRRFGCQRTAGGRRDAADAHVSERFDAEHACASARHRRASLSHGPERTA